MINEYLQKFGQLVLDPLVFVGIIVGFFFIGSNRSSLKARWILLALLALIASFSEYRDQYVPDPPDLVFPLESIRSFGRPIAILILSILFVFAFWFRIGGQNLKDKYNIWKSLLVLQILVFAKNIFYGDTLVALILFLTFFLVYYLFRSGVSRWLVSNNSFLYGLWSIIGVVIIFNLMGAYQTLIDPWPMFFQQNRYMGMTGNPQHAAVLLASSTPVFIFMIINTRLLHIRIFLFVVLVWTIYYLILTGSRTGLLEAGISGLIFLVGYKASSIKWIVIIFLGFFLIRTGVNWDSQDLNQNVEGYTSRENTRLRVINRQLTQFLSYPVFGQPLTGDRLRYGENSYGAVAASLGLIGLIPLVILVRGLVLMVINLWRLSRKTLIDRHYYLLVVAGVVALLVGAFLEAYLLGNLTWPLIMLLTYVVWGYYLLQKIEQDKVTYLESMKQKELKVTSVGI